MNESDRYKYRLLDVCQQLHETRPGGTADPMDEESRQDLRCWLLWRIERWQPSAAASFKSYDDAVHHLACTAVGIP